MPDLVVTDTYECEERHETFHISIRIAEDVPTELVRALLDSRAGWNVCPVTGEHFTPDQRVSRKWRALT